MDRRTRLTALLVILTAAPAVGGTIPVGADYADYADFAANPALGSLGLVSYSGGYGSGVYIGDGWVVTAAHVADSASGFIFGAGVHVHGSDVVRIPDAWNGDSTSGNDVAVIHLAGDVDGLSAATLYTGPNQDLLGETIALTGYGKTGTGQTGAIGSGRTLYGGTNTADALGGDVPVLRVYDSRILFVDFDDPQASDDGYPWSAANAGELEYMIAPGDSGGGVFLLTEDQAHLVGVNSFILGLDGDPNSDYGDLTGVNTLSPHIDWIEEVTELLIRDYTPGDATRDGQVNDEDLSAVLAHWTGDDGSGGTWNTGDFDGDGGIGDNDLSILLSHWSAAGARSVAVPEPATSALMLLLAAVLPRRSPS